MRLLFVSDSMVGGSGRSQRDLASAMIERGDDARFLVDPATRSRAIRWVHEQLADAAARWAGSPLGGTLARLESLPGRRVSVRRVDGLAHETTPVVQNAAARALRSFRPHVVIGSSVSRLGWRRIRHLCEAEGIPTVLYVREVSALGHFGDAPGPGTAFIANAAPLAERVRALGFDCAYLPSVIDVETTRVESTRERVLVINPIEARGVHRVWELARRLPDIPFVVQESWELDATQLAHVNEQVARLPNVELRRAAPPGPHLYRDARLLLVPYEDPHRPRVVVEAQANGIPVVCGDVPALVDAVGPGGVCLPLEDLNAWAKAIQHLWDDASGYQALADAAVRHSRQPEISAAHIASEFARILGTLVEAGPEAEASAGLRG